MKEKGEEVISERHQKDYNKLNGENVEIDEVKNTSTDSFTDLNFEDI